jgi:hypothetical protein
MEWDSRAIPLYNGYSGGEYENATFFITFKWNGICAIPPYIDASGM